MENINVNKKVFKELLDKYCDGSQITLLKKMGKFLQVDDSYEWADKNKSNFNNAINGNRKLPINQIIALENVLNTSLCYLTGGNKPNTDKMYKNAGLRYAAFIGTKEAYEELDKETTKSGDSIISNLDEYRKHIGDYIIEYDSIEGIRFLNEKYGLTYNHISCNFQANEKGFIYISCNDKQHSSFAKIICDNNEVELFKNVFNAYKVLHYYNENNVMLRKDFIDIVLASEKVVGGLLEDKTIELTEINHGLETEEKGLFANPIIVKLLEQSIENELYDLTGKIINYAVEFNSKQLNYLTANDFVKNNTISIDEKGNVKVGYVGTVMGNVINYNKEIRQNLPIEIKNGIKKLNEQVEKIKNISEDYKKSEITTNVYTSEDVINAIIDRTDLTYLYRNNENVLLKIKKILSEYEVSAEIRQNLADKIEEVLRKRMEELSKEDLTYTNECKYESFNHALSFVFLYKNKINSL